MIDHAQLAAESGARISRVPRRRFGQCPLRTVEPSDHRQTRATHEQAECPRCEKSFSGAAIVTGAPQFVRSFSLANFTGVIVERRLFCDHCDHIIFWYQEWKPGDGGGGLGEKIGQTGLIQRGGHSNQVDKFLRDHPQASGVAQ